MRKTFLLKVSLLAGIAILTSAPPSDAAHPLITDDTGTQGTGKAQIEVNGEYGSDRETALGTEAVERAIEAGVTISYGLTETVDVVLGVPYLWVESAESELTVPDFFHANEKGLSDASFEVKWRFYESEGLSLGLKPGVSVPTGSERKGLGAGKYGLSTYLIATQEMEPWVFHLNLGYIRNNNRADEREDLYHVSLATEYRITDPVRLVANIGQEHNPDKTTDRKPVFALAGLIYGISEDLDVDIGFKAGITDPETDRSVLAGLAWRF
jgi:hypothetical protein